MTIIINNSPAIEDTICPICNEVAEWLEILPMAEDSKVKLVIHAYHDSDDEFEDISCSGTYDTIAII
jgi:hypothetical protein